MPTISCEKHQCPYEKTGYAAVPAISCTVTTACPSYTLIWERTGRVRRKYPYMF